MEIEKFLAEKAKEINRELELFLPKKIGRDWVDFTASKPEYAYDLKTVEESIAKPVWDFLERGGKRWRPALMLLACESVGGDASKAMEFTVLPELIHNGCLTADSYIWTADRVPKKIVDIGEGETVLSVSNEGNLVERKVVKKHDNGVKDILLIRASNREIKTTKNHPFLVAVKNQPTRYKITAFGRLELEARLARLDYTISEFCSLYVNERELPFSFGHMRNALYGYGPCLLPVDVVTEIANTLNMRVSKCWKKVHCKYVNADVNFVWREAGELKKGDLLVVTKNLFDDAGELPKIGSPEQNCKDRNIIPKNFSCELSQLAGFLLGDGYIDFGRTTFCIPKGMPAREEYEGLVEQVFGATPSTSKDNFTICSKAVSGFFSKLGLNKRATEKTISDWVFRLPRKHKLSFIKGYLDSDGTVTKKARVIFDCSSEELIVKLKLLLDSLGFVASKVRTRTVDNTHFKGKNVIKKETVLYSVQLSSPNNVLRQIGTEINEYRNRLSRTIQRTVSMRHEELVPSFPKGFSEESFGFNKVTSIEHKEKERTYDIQVEDTHNYISNGMVTHNTIICDDVEDHSLLRRGKPTLHRIYGEDIAINTGNMLYFLPLKIIEKHLKGKGFEEKALKIYNLYTEEMIRLSLGQAMDIYWHRGNADAVTEEQYLQMCIYKTGALARFSAKLGAIIGAASEKQVSVLGNFAASIGVAFQIQDDILNIAPPEKWGKEIGDDINEGKRTLLVIHAVKNTSEKNAKRLVEILNSHTNKKAEILEAIGIIKETGAIEYAKEKAKAIVEASWRALDSEIESSAAKQLLKGFADFVVEREI